MILINTIPVTAYISTTGYVLWLTFNLEIHPYYVFPVCELSPEGHFQIAPT